MFEIQSSMKMIKIKCKFRLYNFPLKNYSAEKKKDLQIIQLKKKQYNKIELLLFFHQKNYKLMLIKHGY